MNAELADDFVILFAGRTDAYGSWSGGMIPNDQVPFGPMCHHLHNGPYVGVYCVSDDNTCRWGCIDLDGKDFPTGADNGDPPYDWTQMWQIASTLQDVLAYKNCTSWTERTANGIHLWVFADSPVPAATMRHALLAACQVAQYQPKEVNPKQTTVNPDKPFGNYVRLPYYGYLVHGMPKDRFVIDENGPMTLEAFSRASLGSRVSVETLEAMATCYALPDPKTSSLMGGVLTDEATEEAFRLLEPILPAVVKMIFADGPLDGDRSAALVKTALILRDDGWQAQACFVVLSALDNRLGKFTGRPDRDERLLDIVAKVGL